ncbi:FAD-dependent monooxygenase [Streptomyces spectabilis]|uniref:FAD-dependent monooxygenase n=1 Tax=Streptomyces spectabilis TaxID=68270 RepID=UPI0033CD288C
MTLWHGSAVVLGAGIAGLLAAAACADHFDQVVVVERDALPDGPQRRRGVPQSAHVHGLVSRGQREIDRLLPGLTTELAHLGVPVIDFGADVAIRNPYGWAPRFPSRFKAYGVTRNLLEWRIRQRVLAHPKTVLRQQHSAGRLVTDGQHITGVALCNLANTTETVMAADLLVDTTGRGSRTDHWLREAGFPAAPQTVIDSRVGYASRQFRIPPDHRPDWRACYVQPGAPHQSRGAMLMPIEEQRWLVTLIGIGPDRPGRREEDFLRFARSLPTPVIAEAIATALPVTSVFVSGSTSNRRRLVERVPHAPTNLVRLGDALCAFNPVYAQGMSIAAAGAALLGRCLAEHPDRPGFAAAFHRRLAAVNDPAWQLAATADLRWPGTGQPRPSLAQRLGARYTDRVMAAATRSTPVQKALLAVMHLERPPRSLLAPSLLLRSIPHRPVPRRGNEGTTDRHATEGRP